MKLAFLKDVKCVYNSATEKFDFSWTLTQEIAVHKVLLVEIINNSEIDPTCIVLANATPSSASYKSRENSFLHNFIVVGVQDYSPDEVNLRFKQRYCELDPTMSKLYMGFSGSGTVLWKEMKQEIGNCMGKLVSIQIQNPFDIPSGFLYYSYDYCSVSFKYTFFKSVEKSDTLRSILSFYLPNGAANLKLEMPDTSVVFVKVGNKSVKKSFFGDIRDKINGIFISRENKYELL